MATAEEVLQTMTETYAETDNILTIDNDLRTITIPPGITNIGVESDDGVHRLHFRMPRQYGEFDLSEFDIRINYLNANNEGDKYAVLDKSAEEDYIDFSWLVGRHALAYRGNVTFIVCLRKSDGDTVEKEFNTTVATLPVLEGLETTEQVTQEYPDALEEILRRLDDLEENGGGGSGSPGKDGVGISKIEKTKTEDLVDTYTITLTDNRTYTFTVTNGAKGDKGDTGSKGDPGKDGITPTIGENGNWYLGEEDTGKPSQGGKGDPGEIGATPNIQIGTVQTLDPGQQATASMTGTPENPLLNLGIPKGEKGDPGEGSEAESYELPIMSDTQLGGGKAVSKTDENVPVAVDSETGQLFVPTYPESASADIPRQEMQNTDTTVTLEPNKLYIFPEMASLTVTLAEPDNSNVANEYHFFFASGATATTLTLNNVLSDAYSIEANMKYEVSILENVAYIKGVSTSET